MCAQCPSQMRHHHVRFPLRLQSRTDAQRKTVLLGKSRGTGSIADVGSTVSQPFRKSTLGKALMHHVQNILSGRSDRIKFTGVARHDQRHLIARAHMVGRTTRNSPTRIGMWNVVPHQQYGIKNNGPKQPTSPVSSHGSVNIGRRRPRSGHGRTTARRLEKHVSRKSWLSQDFTFTRITSKLPLTWSFSGK